MLVLLIMKRKTICGISPHKIHQIIR